MATRDLARLGARVKAHRVQTYSGRKQAADAGGITKDTWQRIEDGRPTSTEHEAQYRADEGGGACIYPPLPPDLRFTPPGKDSPP